MDAKAPDQVMKRQRFATPSREGYAPANQQRNWPHQQPYRVQHVDKPETGIAKPGNCLGAREHDATFRCQKNHHADHDNAHQHVARQIDKQGEPADGKHDDREQITKTLDQ